MPDSTDTHSNAPSGCSEEVLEFLAEIREIVTESEPALLDLENRTLDQEAYCEAVSAVFRMFHSIKGGAGLMGLANIEALTHEAESILEELREHRVPPSPCEVDTLCKTLDCIQQLLNHVEATESDEGSPAAVDATLNGLRSTLASLRARVQIPTSPETADVSPEQQAGERESASALPLGKLLVQRGSLSEEDLDFALDFQNKRLGELVVALNLVDEQDVQLALRSQRTTPQREDTDTQESSNAEPLSPEAKPSAHATVRVNLEKLDALIAQVGDLLTVAQSVTLESNAVRGERNAVQSGLTRLTRVTNGVYDKAMSMRMIPVRRTFRKANRVVRDLSQKLGKEIKLEVHGEDTELDKTVVEAISEPLLHILRNALDHGIESPGERIAAGKQPYGTISLRSLHDGGSVLIVVQDDGRGIDTDAVRRRAIERGIVDADAPPMQNEECHELLFAPGFSTADRVSDISGRGVGMDVVRKNIESIRGRIHVESEFGRGTTFTIRIPLTLAIVSGMLLKVGGALYAVPLHSIRESIRVTSDSILVLPCGQEKIKHRGQVLPILRLHQFHNIPDAKTEIHKGILVIVEHDSRSFAVFVDEILGQRQFVVKSTDNPLLAIPAVSGFSHAGAGDLCMILDIHCLFEHHGKSPRPSSTSKRLDTELCA